MKLHVRVHCMLVAANGELACSPVLGMCYGELKILRAV